MRSLIVTAVSLSMLISAAFAQSNSSSATPSERAAEGQQLAEGQQRETPAPLQSSTLQSVEQQHPEWFRETNPYKACPWDMCPPPPHSR
jgi:hypothetical protein